MRHPPHFSRLVVIPLVVLCLIALNTAIVSVASAATDVTITLTINHVQQHENPDDDGGDGDYFPEIRIGDGPGDPVLRKPYVQDDIFDPSTFPDPWIFTRTISVPDDKFTVPVLIRLWDYDDGTNFGDDLMDISPGNQDDELNLDFDLGTRSWRGVADGITPSQGRITGDGDPNFPEVNDGVAATIGIDIKVDPATLPDTDGDGIYDVVERFGIREADGTMRYDLAAMGINPCRKSVIVTIDYMTSPAENHKPKSAAIAEVRNAFANAPVDPVRPCRYAGVPTPVGVDFIYIEGNAIAEQATIGLDNDFRRFRTANLSPLLRPYAHYAIAAHDQPNAAGVSGVCCDDDKDFLITLGSWRTLCVAPGTNGVIDTKLGGDDVLLGTNEIDVGTNGDCESKVDTTLVPRPDDEQVLPPGTGRDNARVGTVRDQSGTIMHELGHALGLAHGGSIRTNHKPNYLSVMNYSFDPGGIPIAPGRDPARRLDYSREDLPDLDRTALNESMGIQDGTDLTRWLDPMRNERFGPGRGPLNWNANFDTAGQPIIDPATPPLAVDINADDDVCVLGGTNGLNSTVNPNDVRTGDDILAGGDNTCQSTPSGGDSGRETVLTGHDDWASLKFKGAAITGSGPEISFRQVVSSELARRNFYEPDVTVAKTVDKATALPGDTLTYQVKTSNIGKGRAAAVSLTDTLPDGTAVNRALPELAAQASHTETFTYLVPCTTADATDLTNRATVTAKNLAEEPETDTANNSDSATTRIKAPKLTLTATATPTANAAEAVTTKLTAANTGSATATGVTLQYTLPEGVYYSTALDQGTGPRPTNVNGRILTWNLGTADAGAAKSVEFTTRSSLLTEGGTRLTGQAKVTYGNANGCAYDPVSASSTSTVTEAAPSRNPQISTIWASLPATRTAELLARVQATDTRFDTSPADGRLTQQEVNDTFRLPLLQPGTLKAELLATYLNLADRRINAATAVYTVTIERLGLRTVGDAARHAQATLPLPPLSNVVAFTDTTLALVEINSGIAERY
ncbi:CARDB domain-containing protein [Nonomuraea sp. NPDC050022]|uniref:CARDB domain-containing protein n=1 Tax=Nonomuraea sp. NPDC050022 TaxID=3364358 RepID=UPI00378976F8